MNKINSSHIFLFGFTWEINEPGSQQHQGSFNARKNIHAITELLDQNELLKVFKFKINYETAKIFNPYNELRYFYGFTHDVLRYRENENITDCCRYIAKLSENATISLDISGIGKTITLKFTEAHVNLFSSGVGVISFFLENNAQYNIDEVRLINDSFRRVYPAFLDNSSVNHLTTKPKEAFLASKVEVKFNHNITTEETFVAFDDINTIEENINYIPNYIIRLLGESFNPLNTSRKVHISPISDDRMFTMCFVEEDSLINKLKTWSAASNDYQYAEDPDWHKLIYIDGRNITCKGKNFLRELNKQSTYERWLDSEGNSQLYGITPYSFIILANQNEEYYQKTVKNHFTHQYYQMVLLSLVQYGSIVSYSREVQIIAGKIKNTRSSSGIKLSRRIIDLIEELHQNYLIFINRIYFRQVTPQIQGMELYAMLQSQMGIPEDSAMLKAEVEELKSFVINHESKNLNRLASKFLPASVIISFIAWFIADIKSICMDYFDFSKFFVILSWAVIVTISSYLINKILNR